MSKFTLFAASAAFAALMGACAHAGMPRPLAGGPSDPHADEAPVARLAATLSVDEPAPTVATSSGGMSSPQRGGDGMEGMPGIEAPPKATPAPHVHPKGGSMPGMTMPPAPSPAPTGKGTSR